jgi:hypothetical protein
MRPCHDLVTFFAISGNENVRDRNFSCRRLFGFKGDVQMYAPERRKKSATSAAGKQKKIAFKWI